MMLYTVGTQKQLENGLVLKQVMAEFQKGGFWTHALNLGEKEHRCGMCDRFQSVETKSKVAVYCGMMKNGQFLTAT